MHLRSKRSGRTSADLNLVPYIDLLTCMVAFLLITAVWTQLARLQVAQRHPGPEPEGIVEAPTPVLVLVSDEGFNVGRRDEARTVLPRRDRRYDFAGLQAALAVVKTAHPDQLDVTVLAEDRIPFETLVTTMDTALSAGFPVLSLEAAGQSSL